MPEHIHYEDDDLFNPETHHEESDVPVKPLFQAVVIFIVFAFMTHFAVAGLYKAFAKGERKRMDPPQTQVARPANAGVPQNQPLLQPFPTPNIAPNANTPVTDLDEMRRRDQERLTTYGWVDKQHGIVHIPIDQAKEKFMQSGAPASPPAAPAASTPPPGAGTAPAQPAGGQRSEVHP